MTEPVIKVLSVFPPCVAMNRRLLTHAVFYLKHSDAVSGGKGPTACNTGRKWTQSCVT